MIASPVTKIGSIYNNNPNHTTELIELLHKLQRNSKVQDDRNRIDTRRDKTE